MTKPRSTILQSLQADTIQISSITMATDVRHQTDPTDLELMTKDLDFQGLLQPVLLIQRGNCWRLVDGKCRIEAARLLGWKTISACILPEGTTDDQAEFARIMANINRKKITKLERAEYIAGLHENWQKLDPSARHGGDRRSDGLREVRERIADGQDRILRLLSDSAIALGLDKDARCRAGKIIKGLTETTKSRIRGTWLADHQSGLLSLAEQDAEVQANACERLFSDPPQASSVAEALYLVEHGTLPDKSSIKFDNFRSSFDAFSKPNKLSFLKLQKNLILELVRVEGWNLK